MINDTSYTSYSTIHYRAHYFTKSNNFESFPTTQTSANHVQASSTLTILCVCTIFLRDADMQRFRVFDTPMANKILVGAWVENDVRYRVMVIVTGVGDGTCKSKSFRGKTSTKICHLSTTISKHISNTMYLAVLLIEITSLTEF